MRTLRPAYLTGALGMMALALAFPVRMMAAIPPAQQILERIRLPVELSVSRLTG